MKWLRTIVVFDRGNVVNEADWAAVHASYVRSIQSIDNPEGFGTLKLRRKVLLPHGEWLRNGVPYLRTRFLKHMVEVEKWQKETSVGLSEGRPKPMLSLYPCGEPHEEEITSNFGGFDFHTITEAGLHIAIEWETGNISSSHRSMNKLAIALAAGKIQAGVLIVPSRDLYEHLTDRMGNIGELSGYLELWEAAKASVERGLLAITVVEHDELTDDLTHKYLRTGIDGRAKNKSKKQPKKAKVDRLERRGNRGPQSGSREK